MPSLRDKMLKQLEAIAAQEDERIARQKARLEPIRKAMLDDYHMSATPGAREARTARDKRAIRQKAQEEDALADYRLSQPEETRTARHNIAARLKAEQDAAMARYARENPDAVADVIAQEIGVAVQKAAAKDYDRGARRKADEGREMEAIRKAQVAEALADAMAEQYSELELAAEQKKQETTRKRLETMARNRAARGELVPTPAGAASAAAAMADPFDPDGAELLELIAKQRQADREAEASARALLGASYDKHSKRAASLTSPPKTRGRLGLQSAAAPKPAKPAHTLHHFIPNGDPVPVEAAKGVPRKR